MAGAVMGRLGAGALGIGHNDLLSAGDRLITR
jgi:hypothetical protein